MVEEDITSLLVVVLVVSDLLLMSLLLPLEHIQLTSVMVVQDLATVMQAVLDKILRLLSLHTDQS